MQVGDLVVRTYGEGQRPMAIIIECEEYDELVHVVWQATNKVELFAKKYLELVK